MARRVDDPHARVAKLDLVVVMQSGEWDGEICRFMNAVLGTSASRQFGTAGPVVGVHVRVDDVSEAESFRRCKRDVRVDVIDARVDDGAFADGATAKKVRRAAMIEVVERPEYHVRASSQSD